jgi:hypothetical protein
MMGALTANIVESRHGELGISRQSGKPSKGTGSSKNPAVGIVQWRVAPLPQNTLITSRTISANGYYS